MNVFAPRRRRAALRAATWPDPTNVDNEALPEEVNPAKIVDLLEISQAKPATPVPAEGSASLDPKGVLSYY